MPAFSLWKLGSGSSASVAPALIYGNNEITCGNSYSTLWHVTAGVGSYVFFLLSNIRSFNDCPFTLVVESFSQSSSLIGFVRALRSIELFSCLDKQDASSETVESGSAAIRRLKNLV